MPSGKLVDVSHVGNKGVLSERHTIRAVFHDFATLPEKRGKSISSSVLSCHGYKWKVDLYPRGKNSSNEDTEYISVFLWCISSGLDDFEVKAKFAFRVPSAGVSKRQTGTVFKDHGKGWKDFRTRADVLDPSKDYLVDGSLTFEADIQVYSDKLPTWMPKTTLQVDYLKILDSAVGADVRFQVGGTEFPAHRHILEARAPQLAALAKEYTSGTLVLIPNVEASTFRRLLRYVYADDVPKPEEFRVEARELLDVADFFACKGLRLAAESELAASGITVETAADMVLLGDSKNCALLKEAATDFFASNPKAVMASLGWARVKESASVLAELMEILVNKVDKKRSAPTDGNDREYKRMCVSALREKLEEEGLNVDGSREMLIDRLEEGETDDSDPDSSHEVH